MSDFDQTRFCRLGDTGHCGSCEELSCRPEGAEQESPGHPPWGSRDPRFWSALKGQDRFATRTDVPEIDAIQSRNEASGCPTPRSEVRANHPEQRIEKGIVAAMNSQLSG